jgi:hypothetical protein
MATVLFTVEYINMRRAEFRSFTKRAEAIAFAKDRASLDTPVVSIWRYRTSAPAINCLSRAHDGKHDWWDDRELLQVVKHRPKGETA